ncbi:hypothetical protein Leryth_017136 [Lithospermum erythrorhizon]|nr:hypothetical protein Leryth_017136 [Lithospermum erythrorhizon]
MEQNTMLIPQVNIRTRNWTSKITITEDIPALTSGTGLRIKRYILTDNEWIINTSGYSNETPHTSSARCSSKFTPFPQQLDTFTRYFYQERPNTNNLEIMGAVIAFEDAMNVVADGKLKRIQRFTFVDMEIVPICMTLWEEMTDSQGPVLMEAANSRAVVVAKRLSFTTYALENIPKIIDTMHDKFKLPVTPTGAAPATSSAPAQPYNASGSASGDGKYNPQPSAPPPQLYATPNATISILLPYNGGAPPPVSQPPPTTQYQNTTNYPPAYPNNSNNQNTPQPPPTTQYQNTTNYPPAYPNHSNNQNTPQPPPPTQAPAPSAPPYQLSSDTTYPPTTQQPPVSYQSAPSTTYPPTYPNNNNNAPSQPTPATSFAPYAPAPSPSHSPAYPPNSGQYHTQTYPPTQTQSTFPQPCPPQAASGHPQYNYATNAPATYPPAGPTPEVPATNYYQQPQANMYPPQQPAGVWPPPPSY